MTEQEQREVRNKIKGLRYLEGQLEDISMWVYPGTEDEGKRKFLRGQVRKWCKMKKDELKTTGV